MDINQAPNDSRAAYVLTGLVLLSIVAAWVALSLDEAATPQTAETEATTASATERSNSAGDANLALQRQSSDRQTETAQQAAGDAPETLAAIQPANGAPEAQEDKPVSPQVARALTKVIELYNADKIDEAIAELEVLMTSDTMPQMSPFELSRLHQLSFNLNLKKGNYEAALADTQAAIESGGLSERELSQMQYQRGQIFMQMEDYAKAADSLELWVAQQSVAREPEAAPNLGAYYLLAASYYYQNKFDDARDHMETLFSMPGEKQEGWYAMMASLYLQDENYAKARRVLEKMVELYGDDTYRQQLAGINAQLEGAER